MSWDPRNNLQIGSVFVAVDIAADDFQQRLFADERSEDYSKILFLRQLGLEDGFVDELA